MVVYEYYKYCSGYLLYFTSIFCTCRLSHHIRDWLKLVLHCTWCLCFCTVATLSGWTFCSVMLLIWLRIWSSIDLFYVFIRFWINRISVDHSNLLKSGWNRTLFLFVRGLLRWYHEQKRQKWWRYCFGRGADDLYLIWRWAERLWVVVGCKFCRRNLVGAPAVSSLVRGRWAE